MDIERESQPTSEVATELYRRIGLICADDIAAVDGLNGSATAMGRSELFNVTVRSQVEQWQGVSQVWHVALLAGRGVGDDYICRVSEDGAVLYSDIDNYEPIRLDMEQQASVELVRSFVRQLENSVFEPIT